MSNAATRTENHSKQTVNIEKTLIFLHMYKTAGTTLNEIIRRQFPQDAIFYFPKGSSQIIQEHTELLKRLSKKDRLRIKCIWGAPFLGLHKHLPQPSSYVMLLRDPVERVISEYYHQERFFGPDGSELPPQDVNLEDYVRNGMMLAWNGQVRYLLGAPEGPWPNYGPVSVSHDDLEIAKANLREHFIIGLTERFDESLILLKKAFGWRTKDIVYRKQRVGNRPPKGEISRETIKLIEERNELDIQLYQFARQLFEERISQQDSSFRREVQILRLLNKFPGERIMKALNLLLALLRGKRQISDVYHIVYNLLSRHE